MMAMTLATAFVLFYLQKSKRYSDYELTSPGRIKKEKTQDTCTSELPVSLHTFAWIVDTSLQSPLRWDVT